MKIGAENGMLVARDAFGSKSDLEGSGWAFNREMSKWTCLDPAHADDYLSAMTDEARQLHGQLHRVYDARIALSNMDVSPQGFVPEALTDGKAYLPYQSAGIHYGANSRAVLIADPPGQKSTRRPISSLHIL